MPRSRSNGIFLGAFIVSVYAVGAYFSPKVRLLLAVLAGMALIVIFVPPMLAPFLRAPQARGFYAGAVSVATLGLFLADYDRTASILFWTAIIVYWFATVAGGNQSGGSP